MKTKAKQYARNPFDNSTIESGDTFMNNMKEEKKKRCGSTEGASAMAVPAMSTRPRTSALRLPSTYPTIRNTNHR